MQNCYSKQMMTKKDVHYGNQANIQNNVFQPTRTKLKKQKRLLINQWVITVILNIINFNKKNFTDKQKLHSKIRGLRNIGNTCYMNSILQCLLNLSQFNTQLLDQVKKISSNKQNIQLTKQYINLVKEFTKQSSFPINPTKIKSIIQKRNNKFYNYNQHDAQQFLNEFLQLISDEFSRITGQKSMYQQLKNDPGNQYQNILQMSQQWLQYFKKKQDSIINDNFQGQTVSTIECKTCHNKIVTFNNFTWLPVTVPTLSTSHTIQKLLFQDWNTINQLQDYYCNFCQDLRNCQVSVCLFRAPKYLVIQLKRFKQGPYGSVKVNNAVSISQELDIKSMIHAKSTQINTAYKLNSTVHHYGNVHAGHYTANVYKQQQQKWFLINDSITSQQVYRQIFSNSVYLLFYQQKTL